MNIFYYIENIDPNHKNVCILMMENFSCNKIEISVDVYPAHIIYHRIVYNSKHTMSELVKKTGKNNKDTYHFSPDGNFALLASDKNTIAGEDVLFIKQDYIENIQPDSTLYRMKNESDKSKGQIKKATDKPVDYGLIGYKYYKKLVSVSDKYTEAKNDANKKKINKFPHIENDCLGFDEC